MKNLKQRRAAHVLWLTQLIQRHPGVADLLSARRWLLEHPEAPGFSERTLANLRGRYGIATCFACARPAQYYCGDQGACAIHRETLPANLRRIELERDKSQDVSEILDARGERLPMSGVPNDVRGRFAGLRRAKRFAPNNTKKWFTR